MWYVLISVLTIFFVKTAVDDVRMPPKYVSENYIGIFPPTKQNAIHRQLNLATFQKESKSLRYVSVLDLPKNNHVERGADESPMKPLEKQRARENSQNKILTMHSIKPQNKTQDQQSTAESRGINPLLRHHADEINYSTNLFFSSLDAINPMFSATAKQHPIEKLIRPLKIVAFCESGLRHYDESNNLIRGTQTPNDIGVMQINSTVHKREAEKYGLDLKTPEGNVSYANLLYRKEGLRPWNASRSCWEPILRRLGYRNFS